MKILFITRKFPPSVGGMERFAYDLYEEIAKQTDTILIKYGGSNANKLVPLFGLILPSFFVRGCWQLVKGGIDIVHVQDGVLAPLGWLLSRLFRKPFVVVIHGLDITYKNPVFKTVIPRVVRRADAVLCISQAAADEAIARGAKPERTHVIPLGISDNYFGKSDRATMLKLLKIDDNKKVIITVGRLVKRKGVAWFVQNVMPELASKYPELQYLVVGEGAERPAIEAAVTKTSLGGQVKLLGRVDDELLTSLYNGADIFVMPNIIVPGDMEGFGLVSLEAALAELPVIATGVEGIKDAVTDEKNGLLVPLEDAKAFEVALDELLKNTHLARKFGKQARVYTLKKYRWEAVAREYIKQYETILDRR